MDYEVTEYKTVRYVVIVRSDHVIIRTLGLLVQVPSVHISTTQDDIFQTITQCCSRIVTGAAPPGDEPIAPIYIHERILEILIHSSFICACVSFTTILRITRWTRRRQPLSSWREHRAHYSLIYRSGCDFHITLPILLLKEDNNCLVISENLAP